ncbi:MAG: diacylglycerol kinase family lipid kinase [Bacteroidaceae bacterium]|nr:diacylglycerol kinase family lipid kinase [Bacteroidaceae bacterium]
MKKIVFIYNPISGVSGKRMIVSQIESRLDKTLYSYNIRKTEYAGHATELAREAVCEGADVVCAIGGDGTVNEVGRALIDTNTALAIIPSGSGNGLARHLHIPLDPISAIELINEGTVRKMDYGVINLHPFFCTCGVGFDAFISEKFAKSKMRGPIAYIENVLRNGLIYNPETYDIDMVSEEEEHIVQKAFLIACGNASQYGNNFYITPQASVRDGLLDVTIIRPFTLIDIPQMAIHLMGGTLDDDSHMSTYRCKSLSIYRRQPGAIHYDGDPAEAASEIDIAIVPKGLLCVCPKEEGMFDVAETVQNAIVEQLRLAQMRSEELIKINRRNNRRLREQTQRNTRKLREETKKLLNKIKK